MKSAALALALTAGLAAASHTSTLQINNGRATVSDFTTPGPLDVYLNMAGNTLNPATGSYDFDIPAAGTTWDAYVDGFVEVDFDGDGLFEVSLNIDNELIATDFVSPGPFTSWVGNIVFPFPDFEWDTTPYGGNGSVNFTGVTASVYGFDVDNPNQAGNLGIDAYAEIEVSAATGLDEVKALLTAADLLGNGDGVLNFRFNTDLTFSLIPAPGTAALVGLGLIATRRRR